MKRKKVISRHLRLTFTPVDEDDDDEPLRLIASPLVELIIDVYERQQFMFDLNFTKYLRLLYQRMELACKLFVLLLDTVDTMQRNHLHIFLHLHGLIVIAVDARKKVRTMKSTAESFFLNDLID